MVNSVTQELRVPFGSSLLCLLQIEQHQSCSTSEAQQLSSSCCLLRGSTADTSEPCPSLVSLSPCLDLPQAFWLEKIMVWTVVSEEGLGWVHLLYFCLVLEGRAHRCNASMWILMSKSFFTLPAFLTWFSGLFGFFLMMLIKNIYLKQTAAGSECTTPHVAGHLVFRMQSGCLRMEGEAIFTPSQSLLSKILLCCLHHISETCTENRVIILTTQMTTGPVPWFALLWIVTKIKRGNKNQNLLRLFLIEIVKIKHSPRWNSVMALWTVNNLCALSFLHHRQVENQ